MVSLWILICAISYGHRENKVWHARNICLLNWLSRISLACFSEGLNNLKQIWLMVGLWMFINRRRSSVCNRVEWLGPIGHAFGHWPFSGNFLKPSIGFYEHFSSNSNHICTASSVIQIHLSTNQISVLAFFYNFCFVLRSKASIVQELVEVEGLPNNTRFIHIAAGDYHSAAVSGSHFSWTW